MGYNLGNHLVILGQSCTYMHWQPGRSGTAAIYCKTALFMQALHDALVPAAWQPLMFAELRHKMCSAWDLTELL